MYICSNFKFTIYVSHLDFWNQGLLQLLYLKYLEQCLFILNTQYITVSVQMYEYMNEWRSS